MRGALTRALERAWNGDGVRDLLDRAAGRPAEDVMTLASLTSTHLLAFAGPRQALWDEPVEQAWAALSVPEKLRIQQAGLESFRSERWLTWEGPARSWGRRLTVDPALAVIMRARTRPRSVVTLQIKGVMPAIRGYAIDHGPQTSPCYLTEMPSPGLTASIQGWGNPFHWCYRYGLVSRRGLIRLVNDYAVMPIAADSPWAGEPRLISSYVPPVGEANLVARLEVRNGEVPGDLESVVAGLLAV